MAIAAACLGLLREKPAIGLAASNDQAVWSPYSVPVDPPGACAVAQTTADFEGGWRIDYAPRCTPSPRTLFVTGDSHAGAYERMMHFVASAKLMPVRLYTLGSCGGLPIGGMPPPVGCDRFRETAIAEVMARARAGDVVFLPAFYTPLYRKVWDLRVPADLGLSRDAYRDDPRTMALSLTELRALTWRGLAVIPEAPKPSVPTALFRCADWFNQGNAYCRPAGTCRAPRSRRGVRDRSRHCGGWRLRCPA